ncbi:hypothetical protein [Candidatus Binatus sp.]|uniref:hypothetical protein n=1 Tax=Candidatus Binatus sp. TaxID=2811406 RepID=UPI002F94C1B4
MKYSDLPPEVREKTETGLWTLTKKLAEIFALEHGADLIRQPSPAPAEGICAILAQAIRSEWNAIKLRDEFISQFNLPKSRAATIANTELHRAYEQAKLQIMKSESMTRDMADALNRVGDRAKRLWYPETLRLERLEKRPIKK